MGEGALDVVRPRGSRGVGLHEAVLVGGRGGEEGVDVSLELGGRDGAKAGGGGLVAFGTDAAREDGGADGGDRVA